MQPKRASRLERWVVVVLVFAIGAVFGWVCWSDEAKVVGTAIAVFCFAWGLFLLFASDELIERVPRWWY